MKLLVNKLPIDDMLFNNNYDVKAEFTGSDEAVAEDLINMMFDAMLLESYAPYSIIKAMIEIADDKASWFGIDFNEVLKTTLEIESDEQNE